MSTSPVPQPFEDRAALILVVERNPMVQRLERFFLEQAGYSVEFTSDGLAALARAQELRPAILVTEILVPKLDGLSLCRTIKSDPATRQMLVIGVSQNDVSNLSDNIVLLRFTQGYEMRRTLRILKTRGSAHDNREHEVEITNKGVLVKQAEDPTN